MGADPNDDFGNDCLLCYPEGLTPRVLFASFGGIIRNPLHIPPGPAAPNGLFVLEQIAPCQWQHIGDIYVVTYTQKNPGAQLTVWAGIIWPIFVGDGPEEPCNKYFTNAFVDPAGMFYGGLGQVTEGPPSGSESLQTIANNIGLPITDDLRCEVWPIDATQMMTMFAKTSDSTQVLTITET